MNNILYTYGGGLYANLTNRCPCACTFCIRSKHESVGSADSLWLERDPTVEEVICALKKQNRRGVSEIIFCGYGEPLCALDTLLGVCRYIRNNSDLKVRVNTNGLADLIHNRSVAPLLKGLVDSISISLNAPTAEKYNALCRPRYGLQAFDAVLRFAQHCKEFIPNVKMSVVNVISTEDIADCQSIADKMNVPLRIRDFG